MLDYPNRFTGEDIDEQEEVLDQVAGTNDRNKLHGYRRGN